MTSKRSQLTEILKTEYGIGSVSELEKAIGRIGGIDISLFCTEIKKSKEKDHEHKRSRPQSQICKESKADDPAFCHRSLVYDATDGGRLQFQSQRA